MLEKLDKKYGTGFHGITKLKELGPDGQYQLIPDDEWVVFRAKDDALFDTLEFYRLKCKSLGSPESHLAGIVDLMNRVTAWRKANPSKCKVPD